MRLAADCQLAIKPVGNVGWGAIYSELVKSVCPAFSLLSAPHGLDQIRLD
jgi:hypothetical protein